jgi:hypothetical protein
MFGSGIFLTLNLGISNCHDWYECLKNTLEKLAIAFLYIFFEFYFSEKHFQNGMGIQNFREGENIPNTFKHF